MIKAIFKFSTLAILLVVLIAVVLFFGIGYEVYSGKGAKVKFVNQSGYQIKTASIVVPNQACSVKNLGIGGEITCSFKNLSEGSYSVSVVLENGVTYSEPSLGYVTGGINFNDTIIISKTGKIELESSTST